MATTIADYVAAARVDLDDPNPPAALWSDTDLQRHVLHAVTEYQLWRPRETVEVAALAAGSRTINLTPLPTLVRVIAVEYPTGQWPPSYVQFQVYGSTLTLALDGPPGPADTLGVNLYCQERHLVNSSTCTIDPADDEGIVAGAVHFAAVELSFKTTNTVNSGGPQVWQRYRELALDKATEFRGYLTIVRSKVTPQRAYAPAEPRQSRFTVEAPWRG